MEAFRVDKRIELSVEERWPRPRISGGWLKKFSRSLIEANGIPSANLTIERYHYEVEEGIKGSSFSDSAVPGTGLPVGINQERAYEIVEGPIILELVHLTDIGVGPISLERVRQRREHEALQGRIADWRICSSAGQALREPDWSLEPLEYPRKCLKLFLSDGFIELQAIELERLPLELGVTPMGAKIRLVNVPVIAGVAYLRNENVKVIGGEEFNLQKEHRRRLFEELERRMDEDEEDAVVWVS